MAVAAAQRPNATAFEEWIPLARQVVRTSLRLAWKDVFEIYTYTPTIALAEALALEARRAGSDTHITLMTDDLWFTSMRELSTKWLGQPSPVEYAIHKTVTADMYLGGPGDARRMRDIPPEKFDANAMGNFRQDEPLRKRRVRHVDLPIGRVTAERAEAYGLDYEKWYASNEADPARGGRRNHRCAGRPAGLCEHGPTGRQARRRDTAGVRGGRGPRIGSNLLRGPDDQAPLALGQGGKDRRLGRGGA